MGASGATGSVHLRETLQITGFFYNKPDQGTSVFGPVWIVFCVFFAVFCRPADRDGGFPSRETRETPCFQGALPVAPAETDSGRAEHERRRHVARIAPYGTGAEVAFLPVVFRQAAAGRSVIDNREPAHHSRWRSTCAAGDEFGRITGRDQGPGRPASTETCDGGLIRSMRGVHQNGFVFRQVPNSQEDVWRSDPILWAWIRPQGGGCQNAATRDRAWRLRR